jgi:hypothetical protein
MHFGFMDVIISHLQGSKIQDFLILEDGTDRLSRKACNELPI